jgi:hypothetical protein
MLGVRKGLVVVMVAHDKKNTSGQTWNGYACISLYTPCGCVSMIFLSLVAVCVVLA